MMNQETKNNAPDKHLAVMSADAFARFGVGHIAYIKTVVVNGQPVAAIFSADGQQIGLSETADIARAAAVQYSLDPVSVH